MTNGDINGNETKKDNDNSNDKPTDEEVWKPVLMIVMSSSSNIN